MLCESSVGWYRVNKFDYMRLFYDGVHKRKDEGSAGWYTVGDLTI